MKAPARFSLAALLLTASCVAGANDAYPRIDSDREVVRTLPKATLIVGELPPGLDYFNAGLAEFRPLLNYLDTHNLPRNSPVEGRPYCERTLALYLDDASAAKALPEAKGIRKVVLPERTVAALASRGGYDKEKLTGMTKRLETWVAKQPDLKVTGPAYFVYWHPVYVPSFYRKAEVHIPVVRVKTDKPAT